jgi:AcrR family transcriptional regulator
VSRGAAGASAVANPPKIHQRRRQFTPLIATAFIELGYRGSTTAQLAERCGVRENILYRIWPTKKAMFLDAVEHVYGATMRAWEVVIADTSPGKTVAERILNHQADHHGRMRLYRILFAGLTEDDPEIKAALRDVYGRLHLFISRQIEEHRKHSGRKGNPAPALAGWGMIGLGAVIDIQRELEILPIAERKTLMNDLGTAMLNGVGT